MTKSTRPSARSKDNRPDRPYVGFPLFPHATGQWAKKIRGRMVYFGKWDDPQAALEKFQREWPYLSEGRIPPTTSSDGTTLGALCNQFLTAKQNRLDSGELSRLSIAASSPAIVAAWRSWRLRDDWRTRSCFGVA